MCEAQGMHYFNMFFLPNIVDMVKEVFFYCMGQYHVM